MHHRKRGLLEEEQGSFKQLRRTRPHETQRVTCFWGCSCRGCCRCDGLTDIPDSLADEGVLKARCLQHSKGLAGHLLKHRHDAQHLRQGVHGAPRGPLLLSEGAGGGRSPRERARLGKATGTGGRGLQQNKNTQSTERSGGAEAYSSVIQQTHSGAPSGACMQHLVSFTETRGERN